MKLQCLGEAVSQKAEWPDARKKPWGNDNLLWIGNEPYTSNQGKNIMFREFQILSKWPRGSLLTLKITWNFLRSEWVQTRICGRSDKKQIELHWIPSIHFLDCRKCHLRWGVWLKKHLVFKISCLFLERQFLPCGLGNQGFLRLFRGVGEMKTTFMIILRRHLPFSPSLSHNCTVELSRGYRTHDAERFNTETEMRLPLSCVKPDIKEICKI